MKKHIYIIALIFASLVTTQCADDEKDFSIQPLIGFAANSGSVVQTSATAARIGFYTNVTLTEPVTVQVQVINSGGLIYGTDYETSPAPAAGIITVVIDPDDEQPGFTVSPKSGGQANKGVSFQLIDVQGSGLGLAQPTALVYDLMITDTEVVAPGTVTIASIRAMYTGSTVTITEDKYLEGVIISSNDNVTSRSAYFQDGSAGICLRFVDPNTLLRGDKVKVSLSGATISAFSGLLQVNLANAKAVKTGTAALPTPRAITMDQLIANTYESQLVTITGVSFAAANGTLTVVGNTTFSKDGKSSTMRVETYSSFATKVLPSGPVNLTGVASIFTTAQLIPQLATDIQ